MCSIQLYADDTVVYMSHKGLSEVETAFTNDMGNIAKLLENNRLMVNLTKGKTEAVLFGTANRLPS